MNVTYFRNYHVMTACVQNVTTEVGYECSRQDVTQGVDVFSNSDLECPGQYRLILFKNNNSS